MNYKKIIKDLKELNNQLKGQYRDEQNRNYCLQCKIDKLEKEKQELIEYLKKEIEDLEKNKMDFSSDYYVDRKMVLKEILSKVEKR